MLECSTCALYWKNNREVNKVNEMQQLPLEFVVAAAIAQWICLRQPSYGPGLESTFHCYNFKNEVLCYVTNAQINKKRSD